MTRGERCSWAEGHEAVDRETRLSLDVNITMETPQTLASADSVPLLSHREWGEGCAHPSYTVLSITHSELPNVPRAPTRSLSSKGKSMPLTDRLRFVQMFETRRGGL